MSDSESDVRSRADSSENLSADQNKVLLFSVMSFVREKLGVPEEINVWINKLKGKVTEYAGDIWCDKSEFALNLRQIAETKIKKDKEILLLRSWPELCYLVFQLEDLLNNAKCEAESAEKKFKTLQKTLKRIQTDSAELSVELEQLSSDAQVARITYEDNLEQLTHELNDCKRTNVRLQKESESVVATNDELHERLNVVKQECVEQARALCGLKASSERVKPVSRERKHVFEALSDPRDRPVKSKTKGRVVKESSESECDSSDAERAHPPNLHRITPLRHSSRLHARSEKRQSLTPVYDSPKVIKFLKETVGIYDKKNSPAIVGHLHTFEQAMATLGLHSERQKIEFLPWIFESKHRYFFNSLKDTGVENWSRVISEVKNEFGPYRSSAAAKRAILTLKCRPNQSPREFLSVLKNAYSLAEREPEFDSPDFVQLFYDALPDKIRVILARDYCPERELEWLLRESMTLFTVLQNSEDPQEKKARKPSEEIAEAYVKKGDIKFESPKKSYAEVVKDSKPKSTKSIPTQATEPAGERSGSKPQYRKRWFPKNRRNQWVNERDNAPSKDTVRSSSGSDTGEDAKASNSPSSSPKGYRKKKNLYYRMNQMQDNFRVLTEKLDQITQWMSPKSSFSFAGNPVSMIPPVK